MDSSDLLSITQAEAGDGQRKLPEEGKQRQKQYVTMTKLGDPGVKVSCTLD